jgi:hypothetical protein
LSILGNLGTAYENVGPLLQYYQDELNKVEKVMSLDGKSLEQANKENAPFQFYYDQKKVELKTVTEFFKHEVDRIRAKWFVQYKENYQRDLSDREIQRFIDNEKDFTVIYQLYLEVKEMYEKYSSVVDGFVSRGYSLNNITKARVASVGYDTL